MRHRAQPLQPTELRRCLGYIHHWAKPVQPRLLRLRAQEKLDLPLQGLHCRAYRLRPHFRVWVTRDQGRANAKGKTEWLISTAFLRRSTTLFFLFRWRGLDREFPRLWSDVVDEILGSVGLEAVDPASPELSDAADEATLVLPNDECILDSVAVL